MRPVQVRAYCGLVMVAMHAPAVLAARPESAHGHRTGKAENSPSLALFPILAMPGADTTLVKEINARLLSSVEAAGLRVLTGAALGSRLSADPVAALTPCAFDISCVAQLGKKAKVAQVVVARAVERAGGGARIMMVAVNSITARDEGKVWLDFASRAEITTQLAKGFPDIFHVELPASARAAAPPKAASSGLAEPALVAIGDEPPLALEPLPATEPALLAHAPAVPVASSPAPPAQMTPRATAVLAAPAESPRSTTKLTSGSPSVSQTTKQTYRVPLWLTASGSSLAALSVAGVGIGAYWGARSRSLYNQANADTTTLKKALEIKPKADSAVDKANLYFGVGGGALALLATLVTWEIMTRPTDRAPVVQIDLQQGMRAVVKLVF